MKSKNNLVGFLTLLLLAGITAFYLLRNHQLEALLQTAAKVDPWYIAAGLLLMLLFVASEGLGVHLLLAALGYRVGFMKNLKYAFVGFYYASITPSASGGQPAQIYYMNKDGIEVGDATLCMMTIAASYQIGILLNCLTAFILKKDLILQNLGTLKYFALFGGVLNLLFVIIIIGSMFYIGAMQKMVISVTRFLFKIKLLKNPMKAANAVNAQLSIYAASAGRFFRNPGLLLLTLALIMVQILSRIGVTVAVYKAFHLQGYSVLDILSLGVFLALSVESLPLPGAVGAAEVAFITVNKRLFGEENLVSAALLTRGISFYAFLIISGAVAMYAHFLLVRRQRLVSSKDKNLPLRNESCSDESENDYGQNKDDIGG